ncbi:hypothetical protein [Mesorhizobium sp. CAU 1732]|uniref:hypothetical protein n=1 Tax=Mesorhizobium sp. CAU 1732 TaxID=3140358 RepID=UPI0032601817
MNSNLGARRIGWTELVFAGAVLALAGCQSTESDFDNEIFSDDTRRLEKELSAEAAAFGTAQSAIGMAAAFDPTGLASMAMMPAGRAARNAWMRSADARMDAQLERDTQALYRRYGMNPDGTPSGVRPDDR